MVSRSILAGLSCAAVVGGALWLSSAPPGWAGPTGKALLQRQALRAEDRLAALEAEVAYLRSREAALTRYVLGNKARAAGWATVADELERLGFTKRAHPAVSREALLARFRQLATQLSEDLPESSRSDKEMLAWIDEHLREAKRRAKQLPRKPAPAK